MALMSGFGFALFSGGVEGLNPHQLRMDKTRIRILGQSDFVHAQYDRRTASPDNENYKMSRFELGFLQDTPRKDTLKQNKTHLPPSDLVEHQPQGKEPSFRGYP